MLKPDVRAMRVKLGMSQREFATRFGLELSTLRQWEQGLRHPAGPSRVLLMVIEREPDAALRAVAAA